ncbi:small subunit ribosomal protein S19e [Pancytospora epiphaga]|nr:small subunit ribosomal protein S19e [Pancytospora epiphaga]
MEQVFRVRATPLLQAIEDILKNNEKINLPKDHDLIKTGSGRQFSPEQSDWFYKRMAAIVRQAMCKGRVSLTGLGYRYGNRKNRGVRPSGFARGSNFVNGAAIAELEKIGWFSFSNKDDILTSEAKAVLGDIVAKVAQQ